MTLNRQYQVTDKLTVNCSIKKFKYFLTTAII